MGGKKKPTISQLAKKEARRRSRLKRRVRGRVRQLKKL